LTVDDAVVPEGAEVLHVDEASASGRGGTRPGDIVNGLAGSRVADTWMLANALGRHRRGEAVAVRCIRRGQTLELTWELP
jgi:S1-C subfamily serine protease